MSNLIQFAGVPTAQQFATMKELGQMAIASGFLPAGIKTPEQAVLIILKGHELGIPPMQAFSGIAVIQGKPTVGPELMLGLIYRNCPGAVVDFVTTDNTKCVIKAKRPGGSFSEFSFTMEDAKRANLTAKSNWQTFPAAMLRARCISAMARAVFPDAIAGCSYTPEEMGAETDEEGNLVLIPEDTVPDAQGKSRDVTTKEEKPKAESPKKTSKPEAKVEPITLDSLRSYVVTGGKKQGATLGDLVDERGLDYVGEWALKNAEKDADWAVELLEKCRALRDKLNEPIEGELDFDSGEFDQ